MSADVHILASPASSSWPHQLSDHSIVSCSRICPVWAQITWSSQGDEEWARPQQRQDTLKTASAETSRPQTQSLQLCNYFFLQLGDSANGQGQMDVGGEVVLRGLVVADQVLSFCLREL